MPNYLALLAIGLANSTVSVKYGPELLSKKERLGHAIHTSTSLENPLTEHLASKTELGMVFDRDRVAASWSFGLGSRWQLCPDVLLLKTYWSAAGRTYSGILGQGVHAQQDISLQVGGNSFAWGINWKRNADLAGIVFAGSSRDTLSIEYSWRFGD